MTAPLYIALIHYPVLNKRGEIVTTSLTNFDIHDLARTSTTYGVQKYFIVTPNEAQQKMAHYITQYWRVGTGAVFNPDRRDAFSQVEVTSSIEETCLTIKNIHGTHPHLIATSAQPSKKVISFKRLKEQIRTLTEPLLILFGTGWGLAPEVMSRVEWVLEPVRGSSEYNHLPVRAAVAVVLDRLVGEIG